LPPEREGTKGSGVRARPTDRRAAASEAGRREGRRPSPLVTAEFDRHRGGAPDEGRAVTHDDPSGSVPTGWAIPSGVAAGAAIGLLFGILLHQLALGLTVGAAMGLLAGTSATAAAATQAQRRGAVLAVAIALLTAGLTIVLLIVLG
jgi:hypothetical protein